MSGNYHLETALSKLQPELTKMPGLLETSGSRHMPRVKPQKNEAPRIRP